MPIDLKKKKLSEEELEIVILNKFVKRGAWHKYHIYESDLSKGFPPNIRKDIIRAAKELKRRGFLIAFPHGNENVWILNKDKSEEIIDKIKKFYPEYT